METSEIAITFTAAILGLSYPILLEVISRLDEKYSSTIILNLFRRESEWKYFNRLLIGNLIFLIFYIFFNSFEKIIDKSDWVNFYSTRILLIISIALIISFIAYINKILVYYTPARIVHYFTAKDDDDEHIYFQALSDILIKAVRNQEPKIVESIAEYIYKSFKRYRQVDSDIPVQYPFLYYEINYKLLEELFFNENKRFRALEDRSAGRWLLGEFDEHKIHEHTYSWLWSCLSLASKEKKDDFVMLYWAIAHQHITYQLKRIHEDYKFLDGKHVVLNQDIVVERNNQRDRFLEFNYAVGGLLFYLSRYGLIKRIFNYTTSAPARFELLPSTMTEVFNLFFMFLDPFEENFRFLRFQYSYPGTEGIGSENVVRAWSCKYIALLFLRQYSITQYYSHQNPLVLPHVPEKQIERKIWIDNLERFKRTVIEIMADKSLLEQVGLGFLQGNWFVENKKQYPLDLIDEVKVFVREKYESKEQNQVISEEKEKIFFESSNRILTAAITKYISVFNKDFSEESEVLVANGLQMVMDKESFADDQIATHINYDTVLASSIATDIDDSVSQSFYFSRTQSYLLRNQDIFNVIDKLQISKDEYIIVNFGIDLGYFIDVFKVEGLEISNYKGISIISFSKYDRNFMNSTLFFLKKSDLPFVSPSQIKQSEIDQYNLKEINKELMLYASIIDLNLDDDLRKIAEAQYYNDADYRKKVLVLNSLILKIKWKKAANILALSLYSEYDNKGEPHNINDVKFAHSK